MFLGSAGAFLDHIIISSTLQNYITFFTDDPDKDLQFLESICHVE